MAENKDSSKPTENIFQIMDGIIRQINNTKKIFVTLIVLHLILVPAAFIVTFAIFGPPFSGGRPWWDQDRGSAFPFVPVIPIAVVLVWLGVGIRQWYVLSKWTKKYAQYKAMQKKIDEKLDYDENNEDKPQ